MYQLINSLLIVLGLALGSNTLLGAEVEPLTAPVLSLDENEQAWSGAYINRYADIRLHRENLDFQTVDDIFDTLPQNSFSFQDKAANLGKIDDSAYIRLFIESTDNDLIFLSINHRFVEFIELRVLNPSAREHFQRSGASVDMSERPIPSRSFLFPVRLEKGLNQVDFKVGGKYTINIPLRIWSEEGLDLYQDSRNLLIGMAVGAMLIIAIYNLIIAVLLRDSTFSTYSLFTFTQVAHLSYTFGIMQVFAYKFFHISLIPPILGSTLIMIGLLVSSFFIRSFFLIPRKSWLGFTWSAFELLTIVSILASSIKHQHSSTAVFICGTIATILIIYTSLMGIIRTRDDTYIKIYAAGWLLYVLGGVTALYTSFGYIERNWFTVHVHLFVSVGELVLFSLSLGGKMKRTVDGFEVEQRISMHSYRQLEKVFYPHQIRLIKEGGTVEKTMPTSPGKACVICFDIVNSSQIRHERSKQFFRAVLLGCHQELLEGYDDRKLRSRGFRVKEMGDGFLCSVGYPFQVPEGGSSEQALKLCLDFYKIFEEEAKKLDYIDEINCSMGVVLGPVQGLYTQHPPIQYDLEGSALVLATRYEAARKIDLDPIDLFKGSTITVQETVFLSLPEPLRQEFTEVALTRPQAQKLDDPDAVSLYVLDLRNSETGSTYLSQKAS
ncbi:7TM diverse intracellular signaling domain-containing protein [Pseudobacteriovorax antillogorgiicola]|uniref:7TMR-DISM extracellular 2 n=1 Tax=Pseudobacteriovorax antillogorgiicola TaxID=1513793 RepID=A0A1Y6CMD6_9BACT|nr:7TM diverse intracellular signaling domain-containing protein [Pseudobacteriovorax antillogorgiicola]TCS45394.1 7TMR-DISM extracellular protein 2 [Pseudobacteriovorax antillogorgiicola]SMF73820.1 7TMR-DISM extracellular 2 [Pseudobacteriovorax antillogorgiicola]